MEKEMVMIAGLGNPGEEYAHTRHNAGFEAADRVAEKLGVTLRRKLLLEGAVAEIAGPERKIILCEPLTCMNNSGRCVRKLMERYQIPPERLLVIYDDIDLPPAALRFRKSGGPGTHNGMRSIVEETGLTAFPRLRIGTGDRPKGQDLVSWVLGHYAPEERKRMNEAFDAAAEAALVWAAEGENGVLRFLSLRQQKEKAGEAGRADQKEKAGETGRADQTEKEQP